MSIRIKNYYDRPLMYPITSDFKVILFELETDGSDYYTISADVLLTKEVRGIPKGDSLCLLLESIDSLGNCKVEKSSSAPNVIGRWELSITSFLPYGVKYLRYSFICPNCEELGKIKISHIRVTKTDTKVEAFGNVKKRPYSDKKNEKGMVRFYDIPQRLSDIEIVEYFIYAKKAGYIYDLKQIRDRLCRHHKKYNFFYELFAEGKYKCFKEENIISLIQGMNDRIVDRIYENLALSGEKDILVTLLSNNSSSSPYAGLLKHAFCIKKLKKEKLHEYCESVGREISIIPKKKFINFCYSDCGDLPINRWLIRWFEHNLTEIQRRARAMQGNETTVVKDLPVFVFWDKGIAQAPPVVKMCVKQMEKLFGDRLNVIDSGNISYYVGMENCERISSTIALSDYLRTELLMRYGGIWLDSTVFVKPEFIRISNENSDIVPTYMPSGAHLGSWLLSVGERYSYFYCMMYSALNMFLYEYGDFKTYFMFHRFWEIICLADEAAAGYWDKAYKINARNALEMCMGTGDSDSFIKARTDDEFAAFYNLSPVHKLTYKYEEQRVEFYSNVSRMIRLATDFTAKKTCGLQRLNGFYYFFDNDSKIIRGVHRKVSVSGERQDLCYFDENGRLQSSKVTN